MSVYSSPFNPIQWLTFILRLLWEGGAMIYNLYLSAKGVNREGLGASIKKKGKEAVQNTKAHFMEASARRRDVGGDVVDGHTRFANHYRDYMIH